MHHQRARCAHGGRRNPQGHTGHHGQRRRRPAALAPEGMKPRQHERRQAMVIADSVGWMDLRVASRHDAGLAAPSRPFILVSFLGLAWGLAHVGMEALMGAGLVKLGLPVTALWAVVLVLALRRQSLAFLYASVVLGAMGCYWLTMMHYYNMQLQWYGVVPWMTN